MKTKLRGLTITALLLSASHTTLADGGDSSIVGDLPGFGEEAYFSEDATYSAAAQIPTVGDDFAADPVQSVGDLPVVPVAHQYISSDPPPYVDPAPTWVQRAYVGAAPYVDPESYAPVGVGDLRQTAPYFGQPSGGCCDGAACDGSCDSGCGGSRSGFRHRFGHIGKMLGLNHNTWATAEFLMWFPQDRDMPALVSTSNPGTLPILPVQGDSQPGQRSGCVRRRHRRSVVGRFSRRRG